MSFSDPLSFLPLYNETVARIRARFDADINAGLLPTDPGYVDTRQGSFYWDLTQVVGLEIARLWDSLGSETPAAAFPSVAWGEYLDEHGNTFNLPRNPATQASAELLFIGTVGTTVGKGVQVSAQPSDPSLAVISFQTTWPGITSSYTIPTGLVPNVPTVTGSSTGGFLAAGTYYYHVTALANILDSTNASVYTIGESTGTPDQSTVITTSTGSVVIAWSAVTHAVGYNVYRSQSPNILGHLIAGTTGTSITDTGVITPTTQEPVVDSTTALLLPALAVTAGSSSNLSANALTTLESVVPGVSIVNNPPYYLAGSPPTLESGATSGGTDVESDDSYRSRILSQFQGHGAGNIADFNSWALQYPGVERSAVVPIWNGPGTVLVIIMQSDGSALSGTVVTGLQQQLDPVAGLGHGTAPIGSAVTVTTTVSLNVAVSATIVFEAGYSLDGATGTIATRDAITSALTSFLLTLNPGDILRYQQVLSAFFQVPGIAGVNSLLVNAGTGDITLGVNPAQNPVLSPAPVLS